METLRAVIVHGSFGYPDENWFLWAAKELDSLGVRSVVPQFPTPKNQSLEVWLQVFHSMVGDVNQRTILIGHSLGVPFLLRVLENANITVRATILVGGFFEPVGSSLYDPLNASFIKHPFNWKKIRERAGIIKLYASDNDTIVPLERSQTLSMRLGTKLEMVPGAGHFNSKAGYTTFPQLIQDLRRVLDLHSQESVDRGFHRL